MVAGILAVVMIIWGGIQYMSTDNWGGKSEAKGTITNALMGLLLVIGSWLILYTIDPSKSLLNFNISLDPIVIRPPVPPTGGGGGGSGRGVLPGYTLTPAQLEEDSRIRSELLNNRPRVRVSPSVPCINGEISECTNVVGLPQNAVDAVMELASDFGDEVTITGGTEGGHVEHGPGRPVFDLRPTGALNQYLARAGANPQAANPQNGTRVTVGSATYTYEVGGARRSTGNHWHVTVN